MIQITNYHDKPKIGYSKMLLLNNFHLKRGGVATRNNCIEIARRYEL